MAVSSLKVCWSKLSARIRDYIDVVDSYYRPNADEEEEADSNGLVNHLGAGDGGYIRTPRGLIAYNEEGIQSKPHHNRSGTKHDKPQQSAINKYEWRYKSPATGHPDGQHESDPQSRRQARQILHESSPNSTLNQRSNRVATSVTNPHHDCSTQLNLNQSSTGSRSSQMGYTKRKTSHGQIYFVDANGNKDWHDPSVPKELINANLDLDRLIGPLTSIWEIRQTSSGKTYYTNHVKCTTQLTDPRLVAYKDILMTYLHRHYAPAYDTIPNDQPQQPPSNTRDRRSTSGSQTRHPTNQQGPNSMSALLSHNQGVRQQNISASSTALACASSYQQENSPNHVTQMVRSSHGDRVRASMTAQESAKHQSVQNLHPLGSQDRTEVDNMLSGTLDISRRRRHQLARDHNLGASHQDLRMPTGAGNSNTFIGPLIAWFKQPALDSLAEEQDRSQRNNRSTTRPRCNREQTPEQTLREHTNHHINRPQERSYEVPAPPNNTPSRIVTRLFPPGDSPTYQQVDNNDFFFTAPIAITPGELLTSENYIKISNRKDLFDKISILRQELLKQQDLARPWKISISRKRIFEDSFRAVVQMAAPDLKRRLLVKFRGEEGLDYGGVAREWFHLLSKEILNPAHGLFQYTSDDIYNLQINPDSGIVYQEHLSYLNFCGRIIGMAVFHGHFIEGRFTLPFYKMLLNKPITLGDIEFVDPDLHRSLNWILDNDITDTIDTTFLVQHNAFGELQEYELKENGRNISVNEENKLEYVNLYVNYRCRRGIEGQFAALQKGFYEVIAPILMDNFDEHELELLIGGLSKVDIDDWRLHTKLKNCTIETPLVHWFWNIVKSYDEEKRAKLLQFVTGSPRVPIQGFKALQGINSELRLFTIHLIRNGNTDNLPKSHTCFNRIDLPPYESYDKLRDKLTQAIEETMGFAMQ